MTASLPMNLCLLPSFFFGRGAPFIRQARHGTTTWTTAPLTDSTVVPVAAGESVTVKADEEKLP